MRRLRDSSFVLVANGAPNSPPASGVRDFLVRNGAREVTVVHHPLNRDEGGEHRIARYVRGDDTVEQRIKLPSRPPLTYPLDLIVPLRLPRCDCWIGFNNLAAARGIVERKLGRAGSVIYWAVDFVPERFGATLLTSFYDRLDRLAATRSDARVELTAAALEARSVRLSLGGGRAAPTFVAPVGVWLDEVPHVPEDGWKSARVVFIGHLVPRQGVGELVRAMSLLSRSDVVLEIAGRGPLEDELRGLARRLGVDDRVRFHGFLHDHREVDALLASCAVAAAPYDTGVDSFTRFADPSKLRSYTAAGLPIVTTDVPPNARELATHAGAEVVPFSASAIALGIERVLQSPDGWRERRERALRYSRDFDWSAIVTRTLEPLGFAV